MILTKDDLVPSRITASKINKSRFFLGVLGRYPANSCQASLLSYAEGLGKGKGA